MQVLEILYRIATVLVAALFVASAVYGFYAIYYAYFKTKDERQQHIVLRSTATAFGITLGYFVLQMCVQFVGVPWVSRVWLLLHFGTDGSAMAGYMLAVLGGCLFVNKRRAGGG